MSAERPGESGRLGSSTASPEEMFDVPDGGTTAGAATGNSDPGSPPNGGKPNGVDVTAPDELGSSSGDVAGDGDELRPTPGAPVAFADLQDVPPPGADPSGPASRWLRPGRLRERGPRKPPEGRWVNYRVRNLGTGSVLRLAGLFYLCIWLALVVAGLVLWNVGRSTETIDQFEGFVTRLGAYGECVPEDSLEPGTDFERDDDCPDGSVLVDGFKFDDGILFRAFFFGGIVLVVGGTALTTLVVMLYNLLSEVTGGVRYTATREPRNAPIRSPGPRLRR
jgi:hypothetical protein